MATGTITIPIPNQLSYISQIDVIGGIKHQTNKRKFRNQNALRKQNLLSRLDKNEAPSKSALVKKPKQKGGETKNEKRKSITFEVEDVSTDEDRLRREEERRTRLLAMVCKTLLSKPQLKAPGKTTTLLDRVSSGVKAKTALDKWKRKKFGMVEDDHNGGLGKLQDYARRNSLWISAAEEKRQRKLAALNRFKATVKRVCILTHVFRQMKLYAIERGQHMRIGSMLQDEENNIVEKDLLFDQNDFKNKHQFCIPKWAYYVCSLPPEARSKTEIQNLMHLMQPMKGFRKYSQKKQELLAKIVRYESFGRRRVVIRKGHIGLSFYLIYSGSVAIVIQGDEDKAFVDDSTPANIMKRGDSFGELALVKATTRSATVVCLEKTEFFVIDKDAFFRLGIDTFSKEEIEYRHSCINSLELFDSLGEATRKEIADEGRVLSFLSDKVIDSDSLESQFIYFITKGCCYVLRLLDLSEQEKQIQKEKKKEEEEQTRKYMRSISPLSLPSETNITYHLNDSPLNSHTRILPPIPVVEPSSSYSDTVLQENVKDSTLENRKAWSSLTGKYMDTTSCNIKSNNTSRGGTSNSKTKNNQNGCSRQRRLKKRADLMSDKTIERYCCTTTFGLGVFLKVDSLYPGQSFGLHHVLHSHDGLSDARKFALVSSGCEVIRVPRTLIQEIADATMIKKMRRTILPYPSDRELYIKFNIYNKWRCFREELVDHIAEFRSNVDKSLKERCSVIPKGNGSRLTRHSSQSKKEAWTRSGTGDGSLSAWGSPQSRNMTSYSRQSPHVQQELTTTASDNKLLVLTHGGNRLNDLQMSTRSPLLKSRNTQRPLVKFQ